MASVRLPMFWTVTVRRLSLLAADGDELVLREAFAREFAQSGAEAFFDEALLALLFAADVLEFGHASSASEPSGWILRSMASASCCKDELLWEAS